MKKKIILENRKEIFREIRAALSEDIKTGDVTSNSIIPDDLLYSGYIIAQDSGIIAGLSIAELVFNDVDQSLYFKKHISDGDFVKSKTKLATVEGPARSILTAERTALNFLQRMSGIATATNKYVKLISRTKCKVLDTRKTVPGLRFLDKWSVKLGGGENHRMGLFDMVLIKDNHIEAAGGVGNAMKMVRKNSTDEFPIEIEVKTLKQLKEVIPLEPDRIMLDNMPLAQIKKAVKIIRGRIPLEASGNINLQTAKVVAEAGVDFISVGKLTHSVTALDISFLLTQK